MKRHDIPRLLAAWLLTCGLLGAAAAQDCPFPKTDSAALIASYELTLARLRLTDCLGDPKNDTGELVRSFNALTNEPTLIGQTGRLQSALDVLIADGERREAGNLLKSKWTAMVLELRSIRRELAGLTEVKSGAGWLTAMEHAIAPKWRQVSAGARSIVLGGQTVDLLAPVCADGQPPCPEFSSQLQLLRMANLMNRLRSYSQSPFLAQQYEESELALKRWNAYRTDGQHQYFWEVFVNGSLMGKDLCPEDAGTGMRMGFCRVPESQWIVLHPEAGLRFGKSAEKSSDLQAALVVQLIGRYQWKWDGASMAGRHGYSLAATYTQTNAVQRWAYGPMLHYGDMSLAVTKAAGGRWGLVINVALADRYFGRKQEVVDELRNVRKSGFVDLLLGK